MTMVFFAAVYERCITHNIYYTILLYINFYLFFLFFIVAIRVEPVSVCIVLRLSEQGKNTRCRHTIHRTTAIQTGVSARTCQLNRTPDMICTRYFTASRIYTHTLSPHNAGADIAAGPYRLAY